MGRFMNNILAPLFLLLLLLTTTTQSLPYRQCPNCGQLRVPYPLSTSPTCGDPSYKIQCTSTTLHLDGTNNQTYKITSIDPTTQRIVIKPASLAGESCVSGDYESQGLSLDPNRPFNITGSNTILLLNCTDAMLNLQAPINCSGNSICHDYVRRGGGGAARACGGAALCCVFRTGGSQTSYVIRIHSGGCSAFTSFVGLDGNAGVRVWPEPGVELEWALPPEPPCTAATDCRGLVNSKCLMSSGSMRCLCNVGFKWNPINIMCQRLKCKHGKGCKVKKKITPIIGGAAVSILGALILVSTGTLLHHKNRNRAKNETKRRSKTRQDILNSKNLGKSAKIFTGKEIARATTNFSKDNLVGTGGFGEVFRGVLEDGTVTAIKRAKVVGTETNNTYDTDSATDMVLNEVRILCQVNHRSLVRLLGCCVDLDQPLLVYEYVAGGTLFDRLHGHATKEALTWPQRLRIAHQTAEGLAYLHFSAVPPIYHRDVKSSNILLDENLNAKVADFGLSRLVEMTEPDQTHIFTGAQGTLGYLDPDYYRNFQLTDKSDVYSFGVVLLELLTSKRAIDFSRDEEEVNLVIYMKKVVKEERLMEVVDPAVKAKAGGLVVETVKALGFLAAACLEEQRQNRPSMKEAADEIEYIISVLDGSISQS